MNSAHIINSINPWIAPETWKKYRRRKGLSRITIRVQRRCQWRYKIVHIWRDIGPEPISSLHYPYQYYDL